MERRALVQTSIHGVPGANGAHTVTAPLVRLNVEGVQNEAMLRYQTRYAWTSPEVGRDWEDRDAALRALAAKAAQRRT